MVKARMQRPDPRKQTLRTLHVHATSPGYSRGSITFAHLHVRCALGRSGLKRLKREGDGATPIGIWPLRYVLFRPDRIWKLQTRLPAFPLTPDDGWCDAARDRKYNQPVQHPYRASAEELWREDGLYDVIVVLGHNDAPVIAGKGSAVFFHIASPDYRQTEGCVAVSRADMLLLLGLCGRETRMCIG